MNEWRPPLSIDQTIAVFERWLFLPSPLPLLAVLGAVAANRLPGDPVWLLLVGPPGGGKSELLQAFVALPDVHPAATLTEPALLSGTPKKEHEQGAKGGLLREIGDFGIILCKDFGSVLNMQRDARASTLAALREIYDGSWTRHIGTGGGRKLDWQGKVGLVAGCPPTIDRHHAVMGAMGERFVLVRLPTVDADVQATSALAHAGREQEMRDELRQAIGDLFSDMHSSNRALTGDEQRRLITLATFAVRCRSAVERDGYTRQIELIPEAEAPTRLIKVLARLLAGLDAIGVPRATAWDVVTHAALDSMPVLRRVVVDALHHEGEIETPALAEILSQPAKTVERTLEDLQGHRIVEIAERGQGRKATRWRLSVWAAERYAELLCPPEVSEGEESLLLSPSPRKEDISGAQSRNGYSSDFRQLSPTSAGQK